MILDMANGIGIGIGIGIGMGVKAAAVATTATGNVALRLEHGDDSRRSRTSDDGGANFFHFREFAGGPVRIDPAEATDGDGSRGRRRRADQINVHAS